MVKMGIRGFKARVEQECCINREKARLDSGGIQTGEGRRGNHSATVRCNGGSHSVTGRDTADGAAPGIRGAKSPEFGEGEQ